MKNTLRRRTFISAIAMLIVSAIVLTSSTFAWFSMAKVVEVQEMDLTITAPDGVQISANTSAWTTSLTKSDFTGESGTRFAAELVTGKKADSFGANTVQVNHFPELMSPCSSELKTNGYLPKFFGGSIKDDKLMYITAQNDATGGYVVFDVFVKVSEKQKIFWGNSTISCEDNAHVTTAMRMGFVDCGSSNSSEVDPREVLPGNSAGSQTSVMYEVDANNHTEASGYADGSSVDTRYFFKEANGVAPSKNIMTSATYTNPLNNAGSFGNAVLVRDTDDRTVGSSATRAYFNAEAGINRLRVYIWMEGNDVDCANDVAGSVISFNLVLEIV